MRLFAGIDGGQSSTVALIADECGVVLGRGLAGPSDHIGEPKDSTRFARAIEVSLAGALRAAGISTESELDAVVAGISGFGGEIHGVAPRLHARQVRYLHDAPIAHAAAFGLGPGIVVIAGTGSVGYGVNARGDSVTVGGWGFLFGDEGSAFTLARDALARAMRADDTGSDLRLAAEARRFFGVASLRELARKFYLGEIDRPSLARFTIVVSDLASRGDAEAHTLLAHAAAALGELAGTCARRLGVETAEIGIALVGGMFDETRFRDEVEAAIRTRLPSASCVSLSGEPATGALLLAYQEAGVQIPDLLKKPA